MPRPTRCVSDCMPLRIDTFTTLTTRSALCTASMSCSESSNLTFHTTQSDLDGISAERSPRRLFYRNSQKQSSSSFDNTVLQSRRYRGLRATAQKWFRSHRPGKSGDKRDLEICEDDRQTRRVQYGEATLDGTSSEAWVMHRQGSPLILGPATVHETFSSSSTGLEQDMDSSLSSDEFSIYTFASCDNSERGSDGTMFGEEDEESETGVVESEDIMIQV